MTDPYSPPQAEPDPGQPSPQPEAHWSTLLFVVLCLLLGFYMGFLRVLGGPGSGRFLAFAGLLGFPAVTLALVSRASVRSVLLFVAGIGVVLWNLLHLTR